MWADLFGWVITGVGALALLAAAILVIIGERDRKRRSISLKLLAEHDRLSRERQQILETNRRMEDATGSGRTESSD
jgi:hypothetical protein